MHSPSKLNVKVFADGADLASILTLARNPLVKGFTTNPTLMRQAGIRNYESFARQVLEQIPDRPISFEVFSDEFEEMEHQARLMASWGENVYVKIPVTNTRGESANDLLRSLASQGVKMNVTALMTLPQVRSTVSVLADAPHCYISVFAGRIADTGRDPVPLMSAALNMMRPHKHLDLIWASPREVLNVVQASQIGCHVITVTPDLLKKLPLLGKNLAEFSLDTVRMFFNDAQTAGFTLETASIRNLALALEKSTSPAVSDAAQAEQETVRVPVEIRRK